MYRLLYRTKATFPHDAGQDAAILRSASRNNKQANVTGFLLRSDMDYFQVLEGPEPNIKALADRISKDTRQDGFTPLWSGPVEHRLFGDWAMEIHILGQDDLPLCRRLSLLVPSTDLQEVGTIRDIARLAYDRYAAQ